MKKLIRTFLILFYAVNSWGQQVINIESIHYDKLDSGFQGNAEFSFNLVQNQNQVINIGNKLNFIYQQNIHTYLFINEFNFIRANSLNLDYNSYQHLRYKRVLNKAVSGEAFAQTQFNQLQGLKFRGILGAGPRIRIFYGDSIKIFIGPMWMYEYEQTTDENAKNVKNRLSLYLSFLYFKEKNFKIDMVTYYQPNLIDFGDFRFQSEIKTEWMITSKFSFRFSISQSFNSQLPSGIRNNIFNIKNSFLYRF